MTLVGAGATVSVIISALGRVAHLDSAGAGGRAGAAPRPAPPAVRPPPRARDRDAGRSRLRRPRQTATASGSGRTGTALSPLRPAGIADIDGARVDVVSDGGFIEAGTPIEVTRVDGNRVVVQRSLPRQEDTA